MNDHFSICGRSFTDHAATNTVTIYFLTMSLLSILTSTGKKKTFKFKALVPTTALLLSSLQISSSFALNTNNQKYSSTTSCEANPTNSNMMTIPQLDPKTIDLVEKAGGRIEPLDPIGAVVYGIDLTSTTKPPSESLIAALQTDAMATRGFLVFKGQDPKMSVEDELTAITLWGSRTLHSTHGVHPATPDGNHHIFRLSNDQRHGILGVGPQWHNDGSFVPGTFSHVGYRIVVPPKDGAAGTQFCHQGAAYDALPPDRQDFWERLTTVNSNGGVLHPAVHEHPISKRKSIWLHLGMTGAVIEKEKDEDGFRLLKEDEMKQLFHEYNNVLNAGVENGTYGIAYTYEEGDFIIIDNLAVAHRASPEAHMAPDKVGLRIMHRTTIAAMQNFIPKFGLPPFMDLYGPSPFGEGVWKGGGIGFRWDDSIHMQN